MNSTLRTLPHKPSHSCNFPYSMLNIPLNIGNSPALDIAYILSWKPSSDDELVLPVSIIIVIKGYLIF